ncbi:MAG: hypothetical protein ACRD4H_04190 [Candidatus Acidiferrales bacterium]
MSNKSKFLLANCLLGLWVAPSLAQGPGAIALGQISVNGEAAINGVDAIGGASVFSGDRLATRKDSAASVSLKSGNELVLGELTTVEILDARSEISVPLDSGQLEYLSGTAVPIVVTARGTEIVPGKGGGVYAVAFALNGDVLRVTACKGLAELESGNVNVKIAEGRTLVATIGTLQQEDERSGAKGNGTGHSKGRIVKYVITAAGIAGGAALALSLIHTSSSCAVSPTNVGNCESPH